jgi:AcrR family transcriptional regulator
MPAKLRPDLVAAAMTLVAEQGWRRFGLGSLARHAGLPLAEVYAELPGRAAVLRRLGERLDAAMLAVTPAELDAMDPRERLFDLIMRRLEAAEPYRPALKRMAREVACDPDALLAALCNLGRASAWLIDAAGGPRGGLLGLAARKAVCLVYARTFAVWLDDDSPDHAATLAELDRRLAELERLAKLVSRPRARPGREGAAEPA